MSGATQGYDDNTSQAQATQANTWQELVSAGNAAAMLNAWLAIQCEQIPDCQQGLAALRTSESGELSNTASWPEHQAPLPQLLEAAERTLADQGGVVMEWPNQGTALGYPINIDGVLYAVVAIMLPPGVEEITSIMRLLQWGTAWIRDQLRGELNAQANRNQQQTKAALDILATVLEHDNFEGACQAAATELALSTRSERVSIAFIKDDGARVRAVSHSAQFGQQMNLNRLVETAMDEAIDQRVIIHYPPAPDGEPISLSAHQSLSEFQDDAIVLTIPLLLHEEPVGALLFERPSGEPFEQDIIDAQSAIAGLLGPVLEEIRLNDQWWIVKTGIAIQRQLRHVFGPRHAVKKAIAFTLAAGLLAALILEGDYRVNANATLEGSVKRAIVVAFDGYVREAPKRAGDLVESGELLAAIDDREIALERLRLITEKQEKQFARERALSERKMSEVNVISAQVKKTEAQLKQTDEMLARAELRAPFSGLVVSGDMTQSIGAAVRRGDVLFEIAPLESYRVVIQVDESQITDIAVGQTGKLQMTALPDQFFDIVVERITPIAASGEGANTFRVDAKLASNSAQLRPGMEGTAKIEVGERNLFWIWTRPLINSIKLTLWRWFG